MSNRVMVSCRSQTFDQRSASSINRQYVNCALPTDNCYVVGVHLQFQYVAWLQSSRIISSTSDTVFIDVLGDVTEVDEVERFLVEPLEGLVQMCSRQTVPNIIGNPA